uniref:Uncharacterized protein n=1 Tax=Arundo donax TaxID=35708 RepID=A0A0A9FET3_ARUDO
MAIGSATVRHALLMAATMPNPTPPASKLRLGHGSGSGELAPMKTERRLTKDEEAVVSLATELRPAGEAFCSSAGSRDLIVVLSLVQFNRVDVRM